MRLHTAIQLVHIRMQSSRKRLCIHLSSQNKQYFHDRFQRSLQRCARFIFARYFPLLSRIFTLGCASFANIRIRSRFAQLLTSHPIAKPVLALCIGLFLSHALQQSSGEFSATFKREEEAKLMHFFRIFRPEYYFE